MLSTLPYGTQTTIFDFLQGTPAEPVLPQPLKRVIKNTNLGLPYKGSKRKISQRLLQVIHDIAPHATHFYDLFGGGGAMSLCAFDNGYNTYYNELNTLTYYYFDFVASQSQNKKGRYGILPDEFYRFVRKEDFDNVKAEIMQGKCSAYNSFVMLNYSFGNDCVSYFCNKEKELLKEMGHYMLLDLRADCIDYWDTLMAERGSVKGIYKALSEGIFKSLEWRERRAIFVNITLKLEAIGIAGLGDKFKSGDYEALRNITQRALCEMIDKHNPHLPKKTYKTRGETRLDSFNEFKQLQHLQQLQQLQQLERLQRLERLERLQRTNLDYREVKISTPPRDTIIYLDPPYLGTSNYVVNGVASDCKKQGFDHAVFYDWCEAMAKQGYNVFISEYNMPSDRFKRVYSLRVLQALNRHNAKNAERVEGLYMPLAK